MKKIAACIILYEPNLNILIENIETLCAKIDFLVLIDNSKKPINLDKTGISLENLFKIQYEFNNSNVGIAKALNEAVKIADENGYEYIFTFDQDSRPTTKMILNLEQTLSKFSPEELEKGIIISPTHIEEKYYNEKLEEQPTNALKEVETVMTSGNLLNIKLCKKIEGFREDFFIDFVDHEFCLRAKYHALKVYLDTNSFLIHNLGNSFEKYILGRKITVTNHNFIRRYYMTRNRLELYKQYKNMDSLFISDDKKRFVNELIKILIFENDRFRKIKSVVKGIVDYNKRQFGSYD